jgi:hypothetical protein
VITILSQVALGHTKFHDLNRDEKENLRTLLKQTLPVSPITTTTTTPTPAAAATTTTTTTPPPLLLPFPSSLPLVPQIFTIEGQNGFP